MDLQETKKKGVNNMNKQDEIKRIKDAKKNNEIYVSSAIVSPQRTYELFLQALKEVLEEDNNKSIKE